MYTNTHFDLFYDKYLYTLQEWNKSKYTEGIACLLFLFLWNSINSFSRSIMIINNLSNNLESNKLAIHGVKLKDWRYGQRIISLKKLTQVEWHTTRRYFIDTFWLILLILYINLTFSSRFDNIWLLFNYFRCQFCEIETAI